MPPPIHTGWLKKESADNPGSYAKRWVERTADQQLTCYKDETRKDCRSVIVMSGGEVGASVKASTCSKRTNSWSLTAAVAPWTLRSIK